MLKMKGFAMNEGEKNASWLDTPDPQRFIKNAAKFNDLMMMYRCAIREVQTKLEVLDDEFSVEYKRNPISFIKTRIKKPESIYRKLQKLGYDFTAENIQEQLNDVAGVRVVCAFIDDIYTVANLIAGQDDIKVIKIKDYIKNPKPNGYKSYHMVVTIPIYLSDGPVDTKVEIQIRTIAMDFWASLEHKIYYKFEGNAPDYLEQELKACADMADMLDNKMFSLNQAITKIAESVPSISSASPSSKVMHGSFPALSKLRLAIGILFSYFSIVVIRQFSGITRLISKAE